MFSHYRAVRYELQNPKTISVTVHNNIFGDVVTFFFFSGTIFEEFASVHAKVVRLLTYCNVKAVHEQDTSMAQLPLADVCMILPVN